MPHIVIEVRWRVDGSGPFYKWFLRKPSCNVRYVFIGNATNVKKCHVKLPFIAPATVPSLTLGLNVHGDLVAFSEDGHSTRVDFQDRRFDFKPVALTSGAEFILEEGGAKAKLRVVFAPSSSDSISAKYARVLHRVRKKLRVRVDDVIDKREISRRGLTNCLQLALADSPTSESGAWERFLLALFKMCIFRDGIPKPDWSLYVRRPSWMNDAGPGFARLWASLYFRSLFFATSVGSIRCCRLDAESCERVSVPLRSYRGGKKEKLQEFLKFRIVGATDLPESQSSLEDFAGGLVDVTEKKSPVVFTHGANASTILAVLTNDGRLSKAVRPKDKLSGAWVGRADDFITCEPYAGPERFNGIWLQTFLVGLTLDLMEPNKSTKSNEIHDARAYRCIRTLPGHVCTHVLCRVWPNSELETLRVQDYHYRPPFGVDYSRENDFKKNEGCAQGHR